MKINPKRRLDLLVLLVALCLCKVLDNCAFKTIIILALDSNQFINLPFTGGGGRRNNNNNNTFFIQGYSISYNILAAINRSPAINRMPYGPHRKWLLQFFYTLLMVTEKLVGY